MVGRPVQTTTPPRSAHPDPDAAPGSPSALRRLTAFVVRHRRAVMIFWVVAFVAGGMGAGKVSSRLKFDFSLPGQPGYETAQKIIGTYGNGGEDRKSTRLNSSH